MVALYPMLSDKKKFSALLVSSAVLTLLIISHNVLQVYVVPEIEGYIKRRIYFESTISKKGLTLHKGMYWKDKK